MCSHGLAVRAVGLLVDDAAAAYVACTAAGGQGITPPHTLTSSGDNTKRSVRPCMTAPPERERVDLVDSHGRWKPLAFKPPPTRLVDDTRPLHTQASAAPCIGLQVVSEVRLYGDVVLRFVSNHGFEGEFLPSYQPTSSSNELFGLQRCAERLITRHQSQLCSVTLGNRIPAR